MKLFYDEHEETNKISYSSIKYLMEQLSDLITYYEKNIYIDSEKTLEHIRILKTIVDSFNLGNYSDLIHDVNLIDFNENEDYAPFYDKDDVPF